MSNYIPFAIQCLPTVLIIEVSKPEHGIDPTHSRRKNSVYLEKNTLFTIYL